MYVPTHRHDWHACTKYTAYIYNVHFKGRSHCLVYDYSKEFARFLSSQKQSVSNAFHFMIPLYSSRA